MSTLPLPPQPASPSSARPSRLWRSLLLISVMVNLLVVGVVASQFWARHGGPRPGGPAFAQMVPGQFMDQLDGQRRRELMDGLRNARKDMRQMHDQFSATAQQLANALEQEPFDAAKLGEIVDGFTTGPESMAAGGGKALKDFYAKLSPTERKSIASAIRSPQGEGRGEHGWHWRFWR